MVIENAAREVTLPDLTTVTVRAVQAKAGDALVCSQINLGGEGVFTLNSQYQVTCGQGEAHPVYGICGYDSAWVNDDEGNSTQVNIAPDSEVLDYAGLFEIVAAQ